MAVFLCPLPPLSEWPDEWLARAAAAATWTPSRRSGSATCLDAEGRP